MRFLIMQSFRWHSKKEFERKQKKVNLQTGWENAHEFVMKSEGDANWKT